ncbi:MAG TPA: glycosyltransferase [Blastocatellia bacterium]|nr:glycosyltransferase [Blastocatellia bacterium]
MEWHLITSEYPPQPGGVSDYTHLVAAGLAGAGDQVHIWCPPANGRTPEHAGVDVHRDLGTISPADLIGLDRELNQFPGPRRLLVQWVPHGYGYHSVNVPFCLWLWKRAKLHGDRIELMVHEPFLVFSSSSLKQSAAALGHRLMTMILMNCAERVWTSIPAWTAKLAPYALWRRLPLEWSPIPSNIMVAIDPAGVRAIRERYTAGGQMLLGHFGTYGKSITELLTGVLLALLREREDLSVLLLGRFSREFRLELVRNHSFLAARLHATGGLGDAELSKHVAACDVMLQPYPDGISSRRTSAMVGLVHGKPLVTTAGQQTEPLWAESGAVALAAATAIPHEGLKEQSHRLLDDAGLRENLSAAAIELYQNYFDLRHTVARLRRPFRPATPSTTPSDQTVVTGL